MSPADVRDAQALGVVALNQWVGIVTLSGGAPAVADHTPFGEAETAGVGKAVQKGIEIYKVRK